MRARASAACLALTVLAGCGAPPAPDPPANPAAPAPAALPPRPAELSLPDKDPCALFTPDHLAALKISRPPRRVAEQRDGSTCALDAARGEPYYTVQVETISTTDLTAWQSGSRRKPSLTHRPETVAGFPALSVFRAPGTPADCEVLVGVATGQTLRVQVYPVSAGAFTQDALCGLAGQAAGFAVHGLRR